MLTFVMHFYKAPLRKEFGFTATNALNKGGNG